MRTTSLALLVASLVLVGATTSCDDTDVTPPSTSSSSTVAQLDGRSFLLQEAVGYTPVAGTVIRVNFNDGDLDFSGGCNAHSGPFSITDGTLKMSGMSSTLMGCAADLSAQDQWLRDFFESAPTVALDGDTLTLTSGNVVLTFLDREVADPDRPLVGPVWTIDTTLSGGAASIDMTIAVRPTLSFGSDGSISLVTACGSSSGSYTAAASELTFSGVAIDSTATCADSGTASKLSHLAMVFADGTATYGIEAARLTIEQGGNGIMALASD